MRRWWAKGGWDFPGGLIEGNGAVLTATYILLRDWFSFETNMVTRPSTQHCNKIDLEIRIWFAIIFVLWVVNPYFQEVRFIIFWRILRSPLHHFWRKLVLVGCILQSRLHPYDATPNVFETKLCENLFELTNIVCCYETRNVYGMYWNSHDVIEQSRIQEIGDCKRLLFFSCAVSQVNVFFWY